MNVIPFWAALVDEENGGYRLNHDSTGRWRGPGEKFLVTQARMLWFFARLGREGRTCGNAATAGYRFLRDRMWDHAHGGFYWSVDYAGAVATKPGKHLYGQAFALYALCEYAHTSGDPEVPRLCRTLFALINEHGHDGELGGYRESFTRVWELSRADDPCYLGKASDHKLLNTHLHLMEATTSLVGLGEEELARARLAELVTICSEKVVDETTGGCRDEHRQDWTPLTGREYDRASYGHDLENVALLLGAGAALQMAREPLLTRCRVIASHALAYGRDPEQGGFFATGPLGRPADRREKLYWTQAEALLGLLRMWQATAELDYLECLAQTLAWVDARQVDRAGGDWHEIISTEGIAVGDKAGAWKDPYHQTRALLAVAALA